MRGVPALAEVQARAIPGEITLLVIWEPVIATDLRRPARSVAAPLDGTRARRFWDPDLLLAKEMRRVHGESGWPHLTDERGLVWDTVAAWPPGARWSEEIPAPAWSGATVEDAAPVLSEWLTARRDPNAATRSLLDRLLKVNSSDSWAAAEELSQHEAYQPVVTAVATSQALSSEYLIWWDILAGAGCPGAAALRDILLDERARDEHRVRAARALSESSCEEPDDPPSRFLSGAAAKAQGAAAVHAASAWAQRISTDESTVTLLAFTGHADPSIRALAFQELRALALPLSQHVGDGDEADREGAALTLWLVRSPAIVAELRRLAREGAPETRDWASRTADRVHAALEERPAP